MEESKGLEHPGLCTPTKGVLKGAGAPTAPTPSHRCPTSAGMLLNSGFLQQTCLHSSCFSTRYSAQCRGCTSSMLSSVCPRTSPLQGGRG